MQLIPGPTRPKLQLVLAETEVGELPRSPTRQVQYNGPAQIQASSAHSINGLVVCTTWNEHAEIQQVSRPLPKRHLDINSMSQWCYRHDTPHHNAEMSFSSRDSFGLAPTHGARPYLRRQDAPAPPPGSHDQSGVLLTMCRVKNAPIR